MKLFPLIAVLLLAGCVVPDNAPTPGPLPPSTSLETAAYKGEQMVSRLTADAFEQLAGRLERGEIKDAAGLLAEIGKECKRCRDLGYLDRDKAFDLAVKPDGKFSASAAATGLRQLAAGQRRAGR